MEHHFRSAVREDLLEGCCVADAGQDRVTAGEQSAAGDGDLGVLKAGLVMVEHDQFRGRELDDLPAQLGPDGAAGPVTRTRLPLM